MNSRWDEIKRKKMTELDAGVSSLTGLINSLMPVREVIEAQNKLEEFIMWAKKAINSGYC